MHAASLILHARPEQTEIGDSFEGTSWSYLGLARGVVGAEQQDRSPCRFGRYPVDAREVASTNLDRVGADVVGGRVAGNCSELGPECVTDHLATGRPAVERDPEILSGK